MHNAIEIRLKNYFENDYVMRRVPLLVGPSGVIKSALVKSLTNDLGMRLVDIRTAFMSRLDIEGLSEKVVRGGRVMYESSPMFNFIKCTDNYINAVSRIYDEIEIEDQNLIKRIEEERKVPVLFFDEITRAEMSVRQVLTKMLTDKEFMGMSMKKAKLISATNAYLSERTGDLVDLFQTRDVDDAAFLDRFESIYIKPEEVRELWYSWAEKNLDDSIRRRFPVPYDKSLLESEDEEWVVKPYTNYRSIEMYYKYKNKAEEVNTDKYLIKEFSKTILGGKSHISMKDFIEEGIEKGIPLLLVGPSGIAKTSRVRQTVENRGYGFIDINLSELDRVDIEGMTVKVRIEDAILDGVEVSDEIKNKIQMICRECELPENVTIRAPRYSMVKKFQESMNNRVVVYFDECNRVQNTSVMSAVFSAISDNRLFGIDFDPDKVSIVLSCNLSDNYSDAQDLDPALSSRCAIWRKNSYDDSDVEEFKKYCKDNNFNKAVISFLESNDNILQMLSSVETRTLCRSASSTRAFEDLSNYLDNETNELITGNVIFMNKKEIMKVSDLVNGKNEYYDEVVSLIKSRWKGWAGKSFNRDDFKEIVAKSIKPMITRLKSNKLYISDIQLILDIDYKVTDFRKRVFSMFLGSASVEFTEFYNLYTSENCVYKVKDNMEMSEIRNLIEFKINTALSGEEKIKAVKNVYMSILETEQKDKSEVAVEIYKTCRDLMSKSMNKIVIEELSKSTEGNIILEFFNKNKFYKEISIDLDIELHYNNLYKEDILV